MLREEEFISILGPSHIIYIISFLIIAFLLFNFKDWIIEHRKQVTATVIIISLIQQVILYGSYFVFYDFTLSESLPFQISRINSILAILFLVTKNRKLYSVFVFFALFAILSFIYPSRVHPITHPIGISFLINHTITLLLPYYGMISYDITLQRSDRNRAYVWYLLYVAFAYFINPIVNGNYFYLTHKPIFAFLPDYIYIPALLVFSYFFFMLGEWFYKKAYTYLH